MEIEIKLDATEYALHYDKNIEKVCFYVHDKCVVISGLDKNDEVVKDVQVEISKEDALKLAKTLLSVG